jgi:hypothetical protein
MCEKIYRKSIGRHRIIHEVKGNKVLSLWVLCELMEREYRVPFIFAIGSTPSTIFYRLLLN